MIIEEITDKLVDIYYAETDDKLRVQIMDIVVELRVIESSNDTISRNATMCKLIECFVDCTKDTKEELLQKVLNVITNMTIVKPKTDWIHVSDRLPNKEECAANNKAFIVSDGYRSYSEYFDIDGTAKFGEYTMTGFSVDRAVLAWMPFPKTYKKEAE